MRQFTLAVLLLLDVILIGCGFSNSNFNKPSPNNVNGTWKATLVGGDKATMFQFGAALTADSNGLLTFSNFSLTTDSACFVDGETETGSVTFGQDLASSPNGLFAMGIQSKPPSQNTLTLSGKQGGTNIAGSWSLTGDAGCSGSGTFTMTKV